MDTTSDTSEQQEITENSWLGAFSLLICGSTSFYIIGVHFTVLGPIIPILQDIYNSTYQNRNGVFLPMGTWLLLLSLTLSMMIVGAFIGGSTMKIMLTFMSRLHVLQLSHVLNILGCLTVALIGGLTGSYEAIIIGRLIIGIPIGMFYALIPLVMVELSCKSKQGIWQGSASIAVAFGLFCGPVLAHPKTLGTAELWPVAVSFVCIVSVVFLIASLWIPETPFYFVRGERMEQAIESLKKLRNGNMVSLKKELSEIVTEVNRSTTVVSVKKMLSKRQYRRQLIAVTGVYVGFQLTGINHMLFYTDQLFLRANIPTEHVTSASVGVYGIQFLFGLVGPKLVDRFGSLRVNKASTSTMIFALTLFTISQAANAKAPDVMPYIAIVAVAIYLVGFFAGTQLATLVLLGELTTEPTRPTALALGSIPFWTLSWTIGFIPPYLVAGLGDYAMTIWIGASILFLLFQFFYLPDTKGKTADEIQAHFM